MVVELGQSRLVTLSKRGGDADVDMMFNLDDGLAVFPSFARQLEARVPFNLFSSGVREISTSKESFVDLKVVDSDLPLDSTYNVSRIASPSCQSQIQYQRITTRRMTRASITPRSRRGEFE